MSMALWAEQMARWKEDYIVISHKHPEMIKRAVLFSGGLDSFIAWRLMDRPDNHPYLFFMDCGQRYATAEHETALRLQTLAMNFSLTFPLQIITRLYLGDKEEPGGDAYIPYRNLFYILSGALDADVLYIGMLAGDASKDKNGPFFAKVNRLLRSTGDRPVRVEAPLRRLTKTDAVAAYLRAFKTDRDMVLLKATRSCYSAEVLPDGIVGCGKCSSCFRRWVAMSNNGIEEQYLQDPWTYRYSVWGTFWHNVRLVPRTEWLGIYRMTRQVIQALDRKGVPVPP